MTIDMINFDLPKNQSSIIKVVGVGGGGSNAVNHMFKQGIEGVDFFVCNTDAQALDASPVPNKIQLGVNLTEGRGAGSIPDTGRKAAIEDIERIKEALGKNTNMLFITAGMGGGTGTGAAPIIAKASREMGILTVGIVTIPFSFEGRKRRLQAEEGIRELSDNVDTLLVICNDRLRELYGNLSVTEAFAKADNVLTTGAKGIAEIITLTGNINVDFADVRTVMSNSGVAIMGSGSAEGESRAINAVETALASPLLNDNQIKGAKNILLNISSGKEEVLMDEITEITDYIQNEAGSSAEIIWGLNNDEALENNLSVTLVATGFDTSNTLYEFEKKPAKQKKVITFDIENKDQPRWEEHQGQEKQNIEKFERKHPEPATENQQDNYKTGTSGISSKYIREFEEKIAAGSIQPKKESAQQDHHIDDDERFAKIQEREERLKSLSMQMKTPDGLSDLEKQPAFVRRNVRLNPVPASNESQVSRFTLNESNDKKTQIKSNNSFLHDNVD
jgi:cell division protein FtsZ